MFSQSYYPNYYSLDDILVTQENVQVIVETNLTKMGFLDPSSNSQDLKVGQKLEVPLWYALQLQNDSSRFRIMKVQIPDIYKRTSKDICEADATTVNLSKMNLYFYEFGRYLTRFDPLQFVGPMIFETCRERCRYLMNICKGFANDVLNSENKLEYLEMSLFNLGCNTTKTFTQWLFESTTALKTAIMVSNHNKRKRALLDMDDFEENRSKISRQ